MIGRTRAQRKAAALLRAQLSLTHAYERIDYAEDVIKPKLAEIAAKEKTKAITVEAEEGDLA